MDEKLSFLCFAQGREGDWEAICVDLDLSVQGSSFDEVRNLLSTAVSSYVADAVKETEEVRKKLLSRRAPWHVIALFRLKLLVESFLSRRKEELQAMFPVDASPQMHFSAVPGYN